VASSLPMSPLLTQLKAQPAVRARSRGGGGNPIYMGFCRVAGNPPTVGFCRGLGNPVQMGFCRVAGNPVIVGFCRVGGPGTTGFCSAVLGLNVGWVSA
jgi:hypothetical protein